MSIPQNAEEMEAHLAEVGPKEAKEAAEDLAIEGAVRDRLYKILLEGDCSPGIYAATVQAWVAFEGMMAAEPEDVPVVVAGQPLTFDQELERFLEIKEKLAKLGYPMGSIRSDPPLARTASVVGVDVDGDGHLAPTEPETIPPGDDPTHPDAPTIAPRPGNLQDLEAQRKQQQRRDDRKRPPPPRAPELKQPTQRSVAMGEDPPDTVTPTSDPDLTVETRFG